MPAEELTVGMETAEMEEMDTEEVDMAVVEVMEVVVVMMEVVVVVVVAVVVDEPRTSFLSSGERQENTVMYTCTVSVHIAHESTMYNNPLPSTVHFAHIPYLYTCLVVKTHASLGERYKHSSLFIKFIHRLHTTTNMYTNTTS